MRCYYQKYPGIKRSARGKLGKMLRTYADNIPLALRSEEHQKFSKIVNQTSNLVRPDKNVIKQGI